MGQPHCFRVSGDSVNEWLYAQVNPVARHLCGQREIQTGRLPGYDQLIRRSQRCLRLAAAHRSVDDVSSGLSHGLVGCGL